MSSEEKLNKVLNRFAVYAKSFVKTNVVEFNKRNSNPLDKAKLEALLTLLDATIDGAAGNYSREFRSVVQEVTKELSKSA